MSLVLPCDSCKITGDYVPGEGNPNATVMVVGYKPGPAETLIGAPFAGPSGELVRYVFDAVIGSENIFWTNLIKRECIKPNQYETTMCSGHLVSEIGTIRPKIIVGMGAKVTQFFLKKRVPLENVRGLRIPLERFGNSYIYAPVFDVGHVLRSGGINSAVGKRWTEDICEVLSVY